MKPVLTTITTFMPPMTRENERETGIGNHKFTEIRQTLTENRGIRTQLRKPAAVGPQRRHSALNHLSDFRIIRWRTTQPEPAIPSKRIAGSVQQLDACGKEEHHA
jgi:hypothetical protein